MMCKYLGILVGVLLMGTELFAEAPDTAWTRIFDEMSSGNSVLQTQDGGYIMTGSPAGLLKIDSLGNKQWCKFSTLSSTIGECVQQTQDGGYIIGGRIPGYDVALIKMDSEGNEEWYKTFGDTAVDEGNSVQQTQDGGYIITGFTESYGIGGPDLWLIKTDASGNKSWDKTFGDTLDDGGKSVQQTTDGGYIIGGYTSYGGGNYDVWLIKTDSLGNKIWDKTFGGGGMEKGYYVQQTQDGGYIITGKTNSYGAGHDDVWLIKTDSLGTKEWDKTFGSGEFYECGFSVQQTQDSGYIITGHTKSSTSCDVLVIKTDSSGDTMWIKTLGDTTITLLNQGRSIRQTSDDGYIIVGATIITIDPFDERLLLIKLEHEVGIEEGSYRLQDTGCKLAVSPNPCIKTANISYQIPEVRCQMSDVRIQVYDMVGRTVETLVNEKKEAGSYNVNFGGRELASGIYFAELMVDEYKTTKKLILL